MFVCNENVITCIHKHSELHFNSLSSLVVYFCNAIMKEFFILTNSNDPDTIDNGNEPELWSQLVYY